MDDKEVLRRVIQGFELIPAKEGFSQHPYVTKTGKATPDLAKRINVWIKQNFPQSRVRAAFENTYRTVNFYRAMNEGRVRLIDILAELNYTPLKRQERQRYIYVYTFAPEKDENGNTVRYAYVGLTDNPGKRHRQHVNPIKKNISSRSSSPVFRHAQKTGMQPHKEMITPEPVSEKEAIRLECENMRKYKEEGWILLNLAPCGSLGGNIRDEERIINGIDDFISSEGTDIELLNALPGSDYTAKAIKDLGVSERFFNRLKEIIDANNITSNKQLRGATLRRVSSLIEKWDRENPGNSWQKRLFPETTSGREKPKEGVSAFLAEPDNLDKDQLKLITKRAWQGVKPNQEKAFVGKLKKIMDKNDVDTPGGLNALAGNSTISWMLSDQAKHNPDNAWKNKLFKSGYKGGKKVAVESKRVFEQIIKKCCSR